MPRGRSLLLAGLVLPLVGAAAVVGLGLGRGDAAACEVERFAEQEAGHFPRPPAGFRYASFPPTSGPSGERPLVWDAYDEPVPQFRLVHNLLHGGVAVQYGSRVAEETLARVREWYETDPDGIVLAPLPELEDDVVLTAWRTRATCGAFQERAFTSFRSLYRFNGPERPSRESMRRGRGGEPNPLGLRVTPSPVRERATLSFVFAESATVSIEVRLRDADGPVVRRLPNVSLLPARSVRLEWDVRDDDGRRLPAGTYVALARIASASRSATAATVFDVAD
jgi:hypothetical protein